MHAASKSWRWPDPASDGSDRGSHRRTRGTSPASTSSRREPSVTRAQRRGSDDTDVSQPVSQARKTGHSPPSMPLRRARGPDRPGLGPRPTHGRSPPVRASVPPGPRAVFGRRFRSGEERDTRRRCGTSRCFSRESMAERRGDGESTPRPGPSRMRLLTGARRRARSPSERVAVHPEARRAP